MQFEKIAIIEELGAFKGELVEIQCTSEGDFLSRQHFLTLCDICHKVRDLAKDLGLTDTDQVLWGILVSLENRVPGTPPASLESVDQVWGIVDRLTTRINRMPGPNIGKASPATNSTHSKGDTSFGGFNINAQNVHVGDHGSINQEVNITLNDLVKKVAASDDPEAKNLLLRALESKTAQTVIGAGVTTLIGMLTS